MAAFASHLLQQLASLGVTLGYSPRVLLRELVFCISLWLLVKWQICSLHLLPWRKWQKMVFCLTSAESALSPLSCVHPRHYEYLLISFLRENQKWTCLLLALLALGKIQGSSCEFEPVLSHFSAAANWAEPTEMFPLKFSSREISVFEKSAYSWQTNFRNLKRKKPASPTKQSKYVPAYLAFEINMLGFVAENDVSIFRELMEVFS